jgi:hypothetical protein
MKLRHAELEYIAREIVNQLLAGKYIEVDDAEEAITIVVKTMTEDLMLEDRLNEEVRRILEEHANEVQRRGIEYHQMFNMIKARLVRERNLIL